MTVVALLECAAWIGPPSLCSLARAMGTGGGGCGLGGGGGVVIAGEATRRDNCGVAGIGRDALICIASIGAIPWFKRDISSAIFCVFCSTSSRRLSRRWCASATPACRSFPNDGCIDEEIGVSARFTLLREYHARPKANTPIKQSEHL
eukprot:CAMPEP_0171690520 /NCGR_PEP_ID=MMETSP0991-20121206/5041_1 /TAXON_ID=483369 /ORGANISM="non described non described, Strain CCMP2098" /LENGTH=147 /DNA_ID=CAMNT_0012278671 /DNA_START=109 /DNA_END=549 /DNA_ORIENTATION=-